MDLGESGVFLRYLLLITAVGAINRHQNLGDDLFWFHLAGVVWSILGAAMLYIQFRPFADRTKSFVQLLGVFLSLILLGLFVALTRRWGLTLVLDAGALLGITTGSVQIYFKRK